MASFLARPQVQRYLWNLVDRVSQRLQKLPQFPGVSLCSFVRVAGLVDIFFIDRVTHGRYNRPSVRKSLEEFFKGRFFNLGRMIRPGIDALAGGLKGT
mmetsp:Transcript_226/g.801  ORF Transcript_226/g.801 Transcript_226/m.801 type:complete len:98 (-) Transcript_226:80-373(-)